MGLSIDDIKKAKEKGLAKRETSIQTRKSQLQKLKASIMENNDEEKIKAIQAKNIDDIAHELALKSKTTEILFIFDKSGSCYGLENITAHEFMKLIRKERKAGYNDIITTVLFDAIAMKVHDRFSLDKVKKFNYIAGGSTALYDTLYNEIQYVKQAQITEGTDGINTLVVIMTDGGDNVSSVSREAVRKLVNERRSAGWEFIFLGADCSLVAEAEMIGVKPSNAVEYSLTGYTNCFRAIEAALEDMHDDGMVNEDWAKPITDERHLLPSVSDKVKKLGSGR